MCDLIPPCRKSEALWYEISSHELENFACDLIPPCRKSEVLWYVVNTAQSHIFFREILFIYMYENFIGVARPHANHACESMPCDKTERNINAHALANYFGRKQQNYRKQIKTFPRQAGFTKEKHIFSRLAFVYVLSGRLKSRKWKQHTRSRL